MDGATGGVAAGGVARAKITSCTESDAAARAYFATALVIAPLALFALVGSILVVVSFSGSGGGRGSCRRRRCSSASAFFVTLAARDATAVVSCGALASYKAALEWQRSAGSEALGELAVVAEMVLLDVLQFAIIWGTWITTSIAYFRYRLVTRPDEAASAWSGGKVRRLMLLVIALALAVFLPVALRFKVKPITHDIRCDGEGDLRVKYRLAVNDFAHYDIYKIAYSYAIFFGLALIAPLCLQVALSAALVRSLRASSVARCGLAAGSWSLEKRARRHAKVTKVTVALAIINSVCALPWFALTIIREEEGVDSDLFRLVACSARVTLIIECDLNCVLLSLISKTFRRKLAAACCSPATNRDRLLFSYTLQSRSRTFAHTTCQSTSAGAALATSASHRPLTAHADLFEESAVQPQPPAEM